MINRLKKEKLLSNNSSNFNIISKPDIDNIYIIKRETIIVILEKYFSNRY